MVKWQSMDTYPGGKALFWCTDAFGGYAAYGEIWEAPRDDGPRIWDDEDRGFALLQDVSHWAECRPPISPDLH
ncbi:hypothetical protein SAMN04488527_101267 [Aliiroseovarius crassostreae]|uniref:Uncharacterized protein n=1 Tax=Aliiroseovarius crassostreae TaxID=154981 RepID=A0A0P7IJW0_9RHOB|nr:hypothetical protein [Aliiroseovarius crassostreae]KPN64265.1 hypothetical protein AKJ29_16660 [Aliiroseovarius crassostreae]SFU31290.1 hypothetical protein SAMN04488527_101267 [Aliiroseovarius crassostreae]